MKTINAEDNLGVNEVSASDVADVIQESMRAVLDALRFSFRENGSISTEALLFALVRNDGLFTTVKLDEVTRLVSDPGGMDEILFILKFWVTKTDGEFVAVCEGANFDGVLFKLIAPINRTSEAPWMSSMISDGLAERLNRAFSNPQSSAPFEINHMPGDSKYGAN